MANIAVVDDEQSWRQIFSEALTGAGHTVVAMPGGEDAAREIASWRPDLVILDVRMYPSGRETLRALRRLLPGTPVVVASSYAGYRDDPDFASAAAFVEKTPDPGRLLGAVKAALRAGCATP